MVKKSYLAKKDKELKLEVIKNLNPKLYDNEQEIVSFFESYSYKQITIFVYFGKSYLYAVWVLCMYHVCIPCMYYMYVLYVCSIYMYYISIVYVCSTCM